MCTQFDYDSKLLATGSTNGIHIYDLYIESLDKQLDWIKIDDEAQYLAHNFRSPVVCLKWKPRWGGRGSGIIAAGHGNGKLKIWDTSKNAPQCTVEEEGNIGICSIDYDVSGKILATGGADAILRLYDDCTMKVTQTYKSLGTTVHHFNQINCVKFNPEDDKILYSGGADRQLMVHDIRIKDTLKIIDGPNIFGDCIDIQNNQLLVGSYTTKDWIEVWDIRTYNKLTTMKWNGDRRQTGGKVTTAKFMKGTSNGILASSQYENDIKIFDRTTSEEIAGISGYDQMIYSMDVNNEGDKISIGNADGSVTLMQYD
jgi:WD40 repeat protein